MADHDSMEQQIDDLEHDVSELTDSLEAAKAQIEHLNAELSGTHAVVGLFMRAITEGRKDSAARMLEEALEGWMKVRKSMQQRGVIPPDPDRDDEIAEA